MTTEENTTSKPSDFIREAVAEDLRTGRFDYVRTRLPPEPNGYLHIGHVKAFMIDYLIAKENDGELILRLDDTNPVKEETEYVDAIMDDARWLGIEWEKVTYASDYFDLLYEWAVQLVKKGLAYVDDQSPEEVSANRGTLTEPGKNSPYRDRSVEENLDLLERMKNGEFPDGSRVLRAKIDMASGNMNMRDPIMYRIIHEPAHHRTGKEWCIYPMYDWAQGQNDAMHGVTHSLCSIEYEDHRPLYEWFLNQLEIENPPRQIEFARLNLNYTVMSKRKLRKMAVLNPLKVVIENYPDDLVEELDTANNPEDPSTGSRKVPFSKVIYIEQDDFREEPPPKYFRLSPGREVRLRNAYFIKCESVVKDANGEIAELRCTYDPETRGGNSPEGGKVKAPLHWV